MTCIMITKCFHFRKAILGYGLKSPLSLSECMQIWILKMHGSNAEATTSLNVYDQPDRVRDAGRQRQFSREARILLLGPFETPEKNTPDVNVAEKRKRQTPKGVFSSSLVCTT